LQTTKNSGIVTTYRSDRSGFQSEEMQMFTGKFGVEIECFGVDRATVVNAMVAAGVPTIQNGYTGNTYSVWQVKLDGSINDMTGFEVVSRILEGEAGIAEVAIVCNVLEGLGAKVNKSCGMHIHHDVQGWGITKFRNLFKRFIKFEVALDSIQPESRRGNNNRFCQAVMRTLDITDKIDACRTIQQLSALYGDNRYYKLNMQSFFRMGTVEFRNHAGTVSAEKICNYIRLTGSMVQDSTNKVAIKPFKSDVTVTEALDTMLSGMVRRGNIAGTVATYYKKRQAIISTAQGE